MTLEYDEQSEESSDAEVINGDADDTQNTVAPCDADEVRSILLSGQHSST